MRMIDITAKFNTDDKCLDYLERMRWPSSVCCVHCGVMNVSTITRTAGKNKRVRIYQCLEKECGKQFSATSGTIFNDTHLPLTKWFMAIALICEAKKGISAKQVERHLGVNYRTAWHLCHRIREAMQDGGGLLTGVVEADETYLTPKKPRKGKPYVKKEKFAAHRIINHSKTYAIGDLHTNTIENAFSLLKRGVYGTFHKVSIKHLGRYCNEFSYRFNRRGEQLAMFSETLKHLTRGEALPYKKLTSPVSA